MFEVTGVGSLLISDYKEDIEKIFDINKEIVLYSSNEEAFQKIKYYLVHNKERKQVFTQLDEGQGNGEYQAPTTD